MVQMIRKYYLFHQESLDGWVDKAMGFRCSDCSSTPRKVRLLVSKLSIKNDINFKPLLSAAGMAEWVSHSNSERTVVGSKPAVGIKGELEKGKLEEKVGWRRGVGESRRVGGGEEKQKGEA